MSLKSVILCTEDGYVHTLYKLFMIFVLVYSSSHDVNPDGRWNIHVYMFFNVYSQDIFSENNEVVFINCLLYMFNRLCPFHIGAF